MLYRIAELMEGRRPQFVDAVAPRGLTARQAAAALDAAVDRLVWYAGWADKLAQVVGNANPVAGPYFNFSMPEPTGVVAVLAPQESSLLGLVSRGRAGDRLRQHRASSCRPTRRPLPAVTFSEVLATSDVPGGVVNVLTGDADVVGPWLASHMDVNAIDLAGVAGSRLADRLEVAAADNLKRVRRAPPPSRTGRSSRSCRA